MVEEERVREYFMSLFLTPYATQLGHVDITNVPIDMGCSICGRGSTWPWCLKSCLSPQLCVCSLASAIMLLCQQVQAGVQGQDYVDCVVKMELRKNGVR